MGTSAMKDPFRKLDTRILAQIQYPEHPKGKTRKAQMKRVRGNVMGCEACPLQHINEIMPTAFRVEKDVRPRYVVLGEGPGPEETARGLPFSGPVGKQTRALLKGAGLDPYAALYANVVSCMPTNNGVKYRAAKKPEIHACRDNLMAQLDVAFTPYVLMVGGHVFDVFRSDLTVAEHHGKVFLWMDKYVVMAIEHPSMREHHTSITKDLKKWRKVVAGDDDPLKWLGTNCIVCGEYSVALDRDGVPYCEKHLKVWGEQWKKDRERYEGEVVTQLHIF